MRMRKKYNNIIIVQGRERREREAPKSSQDFF